MLAGAEVVRVSNLIVLQYEEGILINEPEKMFANRELCKNIQGET